MAKKKRKHEDTSISLHPLSFGLPLAAVVLSMIALLAAAYAITGRF